MNYVIIENGNLLNNKNKFRSNIVTARQKMIMKEVVSNDLLRVCVLLEGRIVNCQLLLKISNT